MFFNLGKYTVFIGGLGLQKYRCKIDFNLFMAWKGILSWDYDVDSFDSSNFRYLYSNQLFVEDNFCV